MIRLRSLLRTKDHRNCPGLHRNQFIHRKGGGVPTDPDRGCGRQTTQVSVASNRSVQRITQGLARGCVLKQHNPKIAVRELELIGAGAAHHLGRPDEHLSLA